MSAPGEPQPHVSVVVPAWNAADTLGQTLESLLAQTRADWEAIVVDDGSTDGTFEVAAELAARDPRIRPYRQESGGPASARNAGIAMSRANRLLFLDADDWLLPYALERLASTLSTDPALDAAYGGSARVDATGTRPLGEFPATSSGDLFPELARRAVFAIHTCLVRRAAIESVGGFDPTLRTLEDWDLWQRIARTGARFQAIDSIVAVYRTRPGSTSSNARLLIEEGIRQIDFGHSPDPRVRAPDPRYAEGMPAGEAPAARAGWTIWWCGFAIGSGAPLEPGPVAESLRADLDRELDPALVAELLFTSLPIGSGMVRPDWPDMWERCGEGVQSLLEALERVSSAPLLAARALRRLEHRLVSAAGGSTGLQIGRTAYVRLELTEPVGDVSVDADRLVCRVCTEGEDRDELHLPVCDGVVPASVLADAVAERFAWELLVAFFERTLYPALALEQVGDSVRLRRDSEVLAEVPSSGSADPERDLRQAAGWTLFLQELWGRPDQPDTFFYDPLAADDSAAPPRLCESGTMALEVADDPVDVEVSSARLDVEIRVGGCAVGVVGLAGKRRISAHELRVAALEAAGYELCRVAVREALVGTSLTSDVTLRARLANIGRRRAESPQAEAGLVLARRLPRVFGTSASRRAALPSEAKVDLLESARIAGEAAIRADAAPPNGPVLYLPDRLLPEIGGPTGAPEASSPEDGAASPEEGAETWRLPILLYHRVDETAGPTTGIRYAVTAEAFDEQLRYLSEQGYRTVTLDQWRLACAARRPLPGRCVVISFDDGYLDFRTLAWPLLERYGFTAVVFLVAELVGTTNAWDGGFLEERPLLDWNDIAWLQDRGAIFGAHSLRHSPLSGLSNADVVREASRARAILQTKLGRPIDAFAYPYGDLDHPVSHLVGACGYTYGLTCDPGPSMFEHGLLRLPRVEITGTDTLAEFVHKVSPPE
jgi:peptidoglycan/xylan/chitin deacetylase (PgdA/CDA1 family)/GT2 family glycosyltransferase